MRLFIPTDPKTLEQARLAYETGHRPIGDIAAMLGMSQDSFYRRVRIWGWLRGRRRRVRINRPVGAGRGPVVAWSRDGEQTLWHGERWAVDGRVSETVRVIVEDPGKVRAALKLREARKGERQAEILRHLVGALIGLQEIERMEIKRQEFDQQAFGQHRFGRPDGGGRRAQDKRGAVLRAKLLRRIGALVGGL